jgi:hypothetical protein
MTTGSARALARQLSSTTTPKQETAEDAAAVAFARRLQARDIVGDVAGMPEEVDPAEEHWQRVLQFLREEKEAAEEAERRKAEVDKPKEPTTAAELLAAALSQANHRAPQAIPLNGAAVLRAALAGGSGTINGEPV